VGRGLGQRTGTHRHRHRHAAPRSTRWSALVRPGPARAAAGGGPGSRTNRRSAVVAPIAAVVLVAVLTTSATAPTPDGAGVPGRQHLHLLAGSPLPSRALYGWGGNDSGQVGIGTIGGGGGTGVTVPAQVAVASGTTMAAVAPCKNRSVPFFSHSSTNSFVLS